jgi:hypothetical protein
VRRREMVVGTAAAAALAACASAPPVPPLTRLADGRLLVVSPAADFDVLRLQPGWSRRTDRAARVDVTSEAGRAVLTFFAPGGDLLLRSLDVPLIAVPGLAWSWKLETAAFGGGPGDGLPRGLRLVLGFDGGGPTDLIRPARLMRSDAGLPRHERRIEIVLAGAGSNVPDSTLLELAAIGEDGTRRVLRPGARGLTGGWIGESVDLLALYRGFFPADRFAEVTFAFVGIGALPARLPDAIPDAIGHVVEVQLFR